MKSRLNKSISGGLTSSHPSCQIHCTSYMIHELHEPMQKHCLSSFDETRWQESCEIVRVVCRIPQQFSLQQALVNRCISFESVPQSRSAFFQVPVLWCHANHQLHFQKLQTCSFRHMKGLPFWSPAEPCDLQVVGSSSHCKWFMLIPWAAIIDVKVIFVALGCHRALLYPPWAMLRYHLRRGSSVRAVASFK